MTHDSDEIMNREQNLADTKSSDNHSRKKNINTITQIRFDKHLTTADSSSRQIATLMILYDNNLVILFISSFQPIKVHKFRISQKSNSKLNPRMNLL